MGSRAGSGWMEGGVALLLAGCGASGISVAQDAGGDGLESLTLAVSVSTPVLDGLVVTSGEIECERLGLVGDALYDERTQVPRATFSFGAPPQRFAFAMAAPGLYSRLRTEIEHVELYGTWRGMPLHVLTAGDERVVDLRGPDQELSPTQAAPFDLAIDGTQWLTAAVLDGITPTGGSIEIDEHLAPGAVDDIMAAVTASFSLSTP